MKRLAVFVVAITFAVDLFGGLFDDVTKSVGVKLPNLTSGQRNTNNQNNNDNATSSTKIANDNLDAIDAEIAAMPKCDGLLGYAFGPLSDKTAKVVQGASVKLEANDDAVSSNFKKWFSDIIFYCASDGSIETIELKGDNYADTARLVANRLAMYKILKYLEHNFGVVPDGKARTYFRSTDDYPSPFFHRASDDGHWLGDLDTNYNMIILKITDATARKRVQEECERKESEERAEKERIRAEQEAKRRLAYEEEERKRQEEVARKDAEETKYEKYAFYGRYRGCIRYCRDGSRRESVYVQPKLIKDVEQFREKPIVVGKIPLYKDVCSGSTLLWTIGQVVDFKQGNGRDIKMCAMGIPGFEDFKYKGATVFMPQSKESDMLCFYCTTEEVDDEIGEDADSVDDVEVFGFAKTFPANSAAEVLEGLKKKYEGLKIKEDVSTTATICGDLVGLKRVSSTTQYSIENDSIRGVLTDIKYEFLKYDLESKDATLFLYFATLEILKETNKILAERLAKSFDAQLSETRVGIKSGKFRKEMSRFTMPMQSVGDMERGWETPSAEVFAMNTAAIYAIEKHEYMCKDAIKKGRAMMLETQRQLLNGEKAAEIISRMPKGEAILKVLDKNALTILPQLAKERAKQKEIEEEAKEKAARAKALEF